MENEIDTNTQADTNENVIKFTVEQMETLLNAQESLNRQYTSEEWRRKVPLTSLIAANMAELGELLESSPRIGDMNSENENNGWKWWKTYLENDDKNNKVEIVDIIHFSLSVLLHLHGSPEDVLNAYKDIADKIQDIPGEEKMYSLLVRISMFNVTALTNPGETIVFFLYLVDALSKYADFEVDEMFEIYKKKNSLNLERIEGGYTDSADSYEKYDENGEEDNMKMFED